MESREQMAAYVALGSLGATAERPSTVGVAAEKGPYLDDTAKLLRTVDVQAVDLAQSVDKLLSTLSGKMDDISSCSRDYSRRYDNLVSGTEQSIDLAVRLCQRQPPRLLTMRRSASSDHADGVPDHEVPVS